MRSEVQGRMGSPIALELIAHGSLLLPFVSLLVLLGYLTEGLNLRRGKPVCKRGAERCTSTRIIMYGVVIAAIGAACTTILRRVRVYSYIRSRGSPHRIGRAEREATGASAITQTAAATNLAVPTTCASRSICDAVIFCDPRVIPNFIQCQPLLGICVQHRMKKIPATARNFARDIEFTPENSFDFGPHLILAGEFTTTLWPER